MGDLIIKRIGSNTKLGIVDPDTKRIFASSWLKTELEDHLAAMKAREEAAYARGVHEGIGRVRQHNTGGSNAWPAVAYACERALAAFNAEQQWQTNEAR